MRKFERIFIIIALVAILFNILSIAGWRLFLAISLLVLYLFYFFLGFAFFNGIKLRNILRKNSYAEISVLRIFGSIGVGIVLSVDCIGILYTIQHWKDANLYIYTGLAFSIILLLITIIKFVLSKADFYKPIILRLSVYVLFIILSLIFKI